jgi:hypothetical protein
MGMGHFYHFDIFLDFKLSALVSMGLFSKDKVLLSIKAYTFCYQVESSIA